MPSFRQARSTTIAAPPEQIHLLINDFHRWLEWSPWEDRDPDLNRTFTGPDSGVGAHYGWVGNKQVGSGSMEIKASTPDQVEIELVFLAPIKATNTLILELQGQGLSTEVVWTMAGERNVLMSLMGKLFFDKMIAKDYELGLERLKALAEA